MRRRYGLLERSRVSDGDDRDSEETSVCVPRLELCGPSVPEKLVIDAGDAGNPNVCGTLVSPSTPSALPLQSGSSTHAIPTAATAAGGAIPRTTRAILNR